MKVKWMLHMVMLCVCSVEDGKEKEVSLWKIVLYAAVICGYGLWEVYMDPESGWDIVRRAMVGGIPGMGLLIMAKVTDEAIGYADAWLTLIIGISMGFGKTVGILAAAFLGTFITAVFLFIRGKKAKKKRIAFVPFLLLGMAGAYLWIDF